MSAIVRQRPHAEVHIGDAVDNGRLLQRHLEALDLYGPTAVQLEDPGHLALALGVIDQAFQQVESVIRDLTDARDALDNIAREVALEP
jgi:hypothetical protein